MNRRASFALLFFFLASQNACASDEYKLGRLFTTPSQRASIDHMKNSDKTSNAPNFSSELVNTNPIKSSKNTNKISVYGVVKKNNGQTLIWIKRNGQLKRDIARNHTHLHHNVSGETTVYIKIPGSKMSIKIKPGQTYLRDKNKIYDNWQISAGNHNSKPSPKHREKTSTK